MSNSEQARPLIGGQAVLEGVMMRGPRSFAVAVRRPDGTITAMTERIQGIMQQKPIFKLFPMRGIVVLIDTFKLGTRALSYSAKEATGEEESLGTKEFAFSFLVAIIFVILLFSILPVWLTSLAKSYVGDSVLRSLFEGILRVSFFIGYIVLISRMKDIRRVFEYHGAEHKVVHAYEEGKSLTVANVEKYSPLHVGCGTAFLMMVMIIAILVFSFIPRTSIPIRILIQIVLIPVIASLSYEITRFARRHEGSLIVRILTAPGVFLQKLTAKEPDASQIEVAIEALNKVLETEKSGVEDCA